MNWPLAILVTIPRAVTIQWTYAAITCCLLLDQTEDVAELFANTTKIFCSSVPTEASLACRFKTRSSDQRIWSTSEEDLWKPFARFVSLEMPTPASFVVSHF